jgi:hypothetical protein
MTGWREAAIGFEIDKIAIGGLLVFEHKWRETCADPVLLPHPAYPKQIHKYRIYEIGPEERPVRFAVAELSNGVWGFYVPT